MWNYAYHSAKEIRTIFGMFSGFKFRRAIVKQELRYEHLDMEFQQSRKYKETADNMLVYAACYGSNLQAIFQSVVLWKRPFACFTWNLDTSKFCFRILLIECYSTF